MNSFKFIVKPETVTIEDKTNNIIKQDYISNSYLQLDITTLMQYLCLNGLIESGYKTGENYRSTVFANKIINSNYIITSISDINKISFTKDFFTYCTVIFKLPINMDDGNYYINRQRRYCKNPRDHPSCDRLGTESLPDCFIFDENTTRMFNTYLINYSKLDSKYKSVYISTDNNESMILLSDNTVIGTGFSNRHFSNYGHNYTQTHRHSDFINKNSTIIKNLIDEYINQLIKTCSCIHNTMSENIVYTDDPDIIIQVIKNNQKIIDNIKNYSAINNFDQHAKFEIKDIEQVLKEYNIAKNKRSEFNKYIEENRINLCKMMNIEVSDESSDDSDESSDESTEDYSDTKLLDKIIDSMQERYKSALKETERNILKQKLWEEYNNNNN